MHGGNDDVEAGEEVLGPVEGAIGLDVELGAVEQGDSRRAFESANLLSLFEGLLVGHALHVEQRRVVGDREVGVAARLGGGDHVVQGGDTVSEVGVGVQVAADVGQLDEVRKVPRQCGLDLAGVLSDRRGDPGEVEARVHLLLGRGGEQLVGGDVEQAVLGQLRARPHGHLAQTYVVGLGTREVQLR